MNHSSVRRSACRLCGSKDLTVVLPIVGTPPGDHYVTEEDRKKTQETYPLDLVLCGGCGGLAGVLADIGDVSLALRCCGGLE